jgi:hypothetical protein
MKEGLMPQTITKEVYTFDELSAVAKARARDWWREASYSDTSDFDCVIDDFVTIAELMGFDFATHTVNLHGGGMRQEPNIYWSVGYCQSDYASFEGTYTFRPGGAAKVRAHAPQDQELSRIVSELALVQSRNLFGLQATIKYRDYGGFSIEVIDRRNEDRSDDLICAAEKEIGELVKDLARWLYERLRDESDHISSDEYIDESIEANDYRFDEEGNVQ